MKDNLISILKSSTTIYWSFGFFLFITGFIIYHHKETKVKFLNLIKNKFFIISSLITLLFSRYIFNLTDNSNETLRLKDATKQALIAFLIAIFAYLDLKVTPFWLIWLISYYFHIEN